MFMCWKLNIVKMPFLSILLYRFNAFPIKIHISFLVKSDNLILQFMWKSKRQTSLNNFGMEKEDKLKNFYHLILRNTSISKLM